MLKESDGVIARLVDSAVEAGTAASEGANIIMLQVTHCLSIIMPASASLNKAVKKLMGRHQTSFCAKINKGPDIYIELENGWTSILNPTATLLRIQRELRSTVFYDTQGVKAKCAMQRSQRGLEGSLVGAAKTEQGSSGGIPVAASISSVEEAQEAVRAGADGACLDVAKLQQSAAGDQVLPCS